MIKIKSLQQQQGYLLLVAALLVIVIGFMGVAISYIATGSASATISLQLADQAFYVADSGLEIASRYYLSKGVACTSISGNVDLTNATVGNGKFTVTGTLYTGANNLSSAILSNNTTIAVTSTAGFAPSGFLTIDSENMTYAAISGNSFTGVMRGYNNTTPASHAINAAVSQSQCVLDSTAGVPNLTAPKAKRELIKNISPQTAATYYAVGNATGGLETILTYNGTTWVRVSPSVAGTVNLNSVALLSPTSGWAVGATNTFYRLTGTTWTAVASGLSNTAYNEIDCPAANNCQVVANSRRAGRWNGTSWTQNNPSGGSSVNLQAIDCSSGTNCWTAGASATNFYQGTGSPLAWTNVGVSLTTTSFNGLFCNSATDCWAVGNSATFARRNGATWANFASGMPATTYNHVTCTSSTNCWAVGNSVGVTNTLVQWNGTNWIRYTATNPIPSAIFNSVACANANDCWAVGSSGSSTAFIRYNGSTWSQVSPAGMPAVILRSVAVNGSGAGAPWETWYEKFS
jgi:hypothetical protein